MVQMVPTEDGVDTYNIPFKIRSAVVHAYQRTNNPHSSVKHTSSSAALSLQQCHDVLERKHTQLVLSRDSQDDRPHRVLSEISAIVKTN